MEPINVPKKVNRHVLKALEFLQQPRTRYVSIEAISDRVRHSLRYTKPVLNLDCAIQESLRKQNELGIVRRSGSSYAMALAFKGIQKKEGRLRNGDGLTADEVAKVRKMLHGVQKHSVRRKRNATVAPRVLFIPDVAQSRIVPDRAPTGLKKDESFHIPKKVNRHVLKAVRYLTEKERYEFAPLDTIKIQAMWSMRNLNPVKDIESVIERSLANLSNVGVLSEQHQAYRLGCGEPLPAATSMSIFGKVSASFFPSRSAQAQNIPYMEESQGPMPHVPDSQSSSYRGGESYFQASGSLSSLTSQSTNTRQTEGVFGMEKGLCGSLSSLPLVSSESISTSTPGEASANSPSFSSLSSQTEGVGMENSSIIGLCGSLSYEELALATLCRERQNAIGANNTSVMDLDEVVSRDPVNQEVQTYLEAINIDIVENASSVGARGSAFDVQFTQELENIFGANNFSPTDSDQQITNDSNISVIQEMQYYFGAQQTSPDAMDLDIRPFEEVLGTEANVDNAFSVEPRGSPFCMQLAQVGSESLTGEMHNAYAEDSGAQVNSISTGSYSYEMHNTEDREMPSYETNSDRAAVPISQVSPRFHESLLQSIPNEAPRGPIFQADQNDKDEQ